MSSAIDTTAATPVTAEAPTSVAVPPTVPASTIASSGVAVADAEPAVPVTQVVVPPVAAPQPAAVPSGAAPAAATTSRKSKKKKGGVSMATASSSQPGSQGENTGRWTAEEHRLFLQGLEQHGKGWKKIASLIKSRTVVQIRTHAQKYFQKLAKARQNGEEGDVTMEGRGGAASVTSASSDFVAQNNKRRRQVIGTKRKAIQSVVTSAQRQGKKIALAQAGSGVPNPIPPLPTVAPALAHFVLPDAGDPSTVSSSAPDAQGTISGSALEDSLFRFLSPAPPAPLTETQVNDVARQAGANPITLPTDNPSSAPTATGGESSPTGVADLSFYPSWTDAKDTPSWYAKGADVDALLDVADTLDWLTDTGDLQENYQPHPEDNSSILEDHHAGHCSDPGQLNSASVGTLPHVDSNVDSIMPSLPDIFEGVHESTNSFQNLTKHIGVSSDALKASASGVSIDEHLQVFDTPMEEHDFVSTILEHSSDDTDCLPSLT